MDSGSESEANMMPIVKKTPPTVERRMQLEEPLSQLLDDHSKFVDCTPDPAANFTLPRMFARDKDYQKRRASQSAGLTARETTASCHSARTA
jgi:hypothetical protein